MPKLIPAHAREAPARRKLMWIFLGVLSLLVFLLYLWNQRFGQPEDFDQMEDQFKYGSIGSDHPLAQAPIPYWLWKVLPTILPPASTMPSIVPVAGGQPVKLVPANAVNSYEAFGLVVEDKRDAPHGAAAGQPAFDRPIGFSRRRVLGMDFVGMNCAFCHLGTFKATEGAPRQLVLGGTGNAVDVEQYFLYLFTALTSERLTADLVMPAIDAELTRQSAELGWLQRLLYRYLLIPQLPKYLKGLEQGTFDFIVPNNANRLPEFGPGRVDTWSIYKRVFVNPPQHDSIAGTSDFTSLWNQKAREGMRLHWDGNTDVLVERNVVSALSLIGKRVEYLDFDRLTRVTDWIHGVLPPRYPDRFPQALLDKGQVAVRPDLLTRGAAVFNEQCARCHAPGADRLGRVEPLVDLGTDGGRIKAFTAALRDGLNTLGTDKWQLRHFELQTGYVNAPLDGLWLRAPYLHNGSVPTLTDLLNPPDKRPTRFCRGAEVYDWENLGFVSATKQVDGRESCANQFLYDTKVAGNSNSGHLYGTALSADDKRALLEFLKTL